MLITILIVLMQTVAMTAGDLLLAKGMKQVGECRRPEPDSLPHEDVSHSSERLNINRRRLPGDILAPLARSSFACPS